MHILSQPQARHCRVISIVHRTTTTTHVVPPVLSVEPIVRFSSFRNPVPNCPAELRSVHHLQIILEILFGKIYRFFIHYFPFCVHATDGHLRDLIPFQHMTIKRPLALDLAVVSYVSMLVRVYQKKCSS